MCREKRSCWKELSQVSKDVILVNVRSRSAHYTQRFTARYNVCYEPHSIVRVVPTEILISFGRSENDEQKKKTNKILWKHDRLAVTRTTCKACKYYILHILYCTVTMW